MTQQEKIKKIEDETNYLKRRLFHLEKYISSLDKEISRLSSLV